MSDVMELTSLGSTACQSKHAGNIKATSNGPGIIRHKSHDTVHIVDETMARGSETSEKVWRIYCDGPKLQPPRCEDTAGYSGYDRSGSASFSGVKMVRCKLCFDDCHPMDMYHLEQCSCSFCQSIEKLVEKSDFKKFKHLRFEIEVDMDPYRMFCPRPGCESVCEIRPVGAPGALPPSSSSSSSSSSFPTGSHSTVATPVAVNCRKCGTTFCSLCKEDWHERQTCDEHMRSNGRTGRDTDGIPMVSAEDANIKRCPVCHVPIERNDGCAQMMCKRCKHVFCWYCLANLDDDFLLRHYDKGRCKNRLGHSRASVIWHRTQVFGIMAGFGVLLLVASPFLLLAAPCILCCKCKSCHVMDEEENMTDTGGTGNTAGTGNATGTGMTAGAAASGGATSM